MTTVERLIKHESNIEALREISLFLLSQSEELGRKLQRQQAAEAKVKAQSQTWLNSQLEAHLHKITRRFFENGRETLQTRSRDRRVDQKKQLLLHARSLAGEAPANEKSNLPIETRIHLADALEVLALAQKSDPGLTAENAVVREVPDFVETSCEITVTERVFTKVEHRRQKYKVTNVTTKKETIVTAPGPLKLLPGSRYSVDFALSVVAGKFLNHLPYERQRKDMSRLGLDVPVMTLSRLAEYVSVHCLDVVERIRLDIFRCRLACHLDETRWPILQKDASDGQMWVLSNQAGSYYRFEPARSGEIADELLKNYEGAVLTDKFSGYLHFRNQKNLKWGLCWSHARREFFDLRAVYEAEVMKIVEAIDDLFDIERKARTWSELQSLRESESKPKLAEIKTLLEDARAEFLDQDDFCKAANYVLSAWTEFTAFADDVRLPLSNNEAERALRHAVLGRKNFNGSKTINGADAAATLYSVIESCKKVQLDPIDYMKYVICENASDRDPLTPLSRARQIRGVIDDGKDENQNHESAILSAQ